ncbi:MAG: histidinol-phosphate aminotransferase [Thiotrichaceae bacterium]|jgi:histidinol-phosphate aminotransferase|nr:histidinol-phosphate transaminase [Gammaproteobacteria bacterium]GIR91931.1 MAG: histidinol-phosphate aminotransferase [Thiotrichaceae bacterium]|tara:strand:+ start:1217 stop:2287 length:1071 start_codon:yes stop_codon:yes gene_type:complete
MVNYKKYLREDINNFKEYFIDNPENMIKLDAMEYPVDKSLRDVIKSLNINEKEILLNRYPESHSQELEKIILDYFGLNSNFGVNFGNGSDELIQNICLAFSKKGNNVMVPSPSFSMYEKIISTVNLKYIPEYLNEDFDIKIDQMIKNISKYKPAIIFLACPNNPTSNLWDKDKIIQIIESSESIVVIDEAYVDFCESSYIDLIEKYENLVILRTFSKIGFAGLRLGFMISNKEISSIINKIRLPFNINTVSLKIIINIFENFSIIKKNCQNIISLREKLYSDLSELRNIKVLKSSTNFLIFKTLNKSSDEIYKLLKDSNILIKNLNNNSNLKNFLRVTVGTEEENNSFVSTLSKYL